MKQNNIEFFIPENIDQSDALKRTTHLAIGAHQDDIEIMASGPILECFQNQNKWFSAVIVTDGANSSRTGKYKNYSNEQMTDIRNKEQKKAAIIGEYSSLALLNYPSNMVKNNNQNVVDDIVKILELSTPDFVYTHNLADKHDTHVAVALRTIEAIRKLPENIRPKKLLGCEVWRDLDWLTDEDKTVFNLSDHENLQASLMGVFDSQISGGKRYDLATAGRRKANATYFQSHAVDNASALSFCMDLSTLILDINLDPSTLLQEYLNRFNFEVINRIKKLQK